MPRLPRPTESVRLNLEVKPVIRKQIEDLREQTGAESLTEVIRRALLVYEVIVRIHRNGDRIIVRDAGSVEKELIVIP